MVVGRSCVYVRIIDAKRIPFIASVRAVFGGVPLPEWQVGGPKPSGSYLFVDAVETMPASIYVSLNSHGIDHFLATSSD